MDEDEEAVHCAFMVSSYPVKCKLRMIVNIVNNGDKVIHLAAFSEFPLPSEAKVG